MIRGSLYVMAVLCMSLATIAFIVFLVWRATRFPSK